MKIEYVVIQEKIKDARNSKKITQRRLAEICDLSEKTISRAEREAHKLDFATLSNIAEKLEIKIDGYLYKKAFSINRSSQLIKVLSNEFQLKVHPLEFSAQELEGIIRVVEILEKDLKNKPSSIKLRTQKNLLLENEKLKKMGIEGFYTTFLEKDLPVLNIYFLREADESIKERDSQRYIEVFKEEIL